MFYTAVCDPGAALSTRSTASIMYLHMLWNLDSLLLLVLLTIAVEVVTIAGRFVLGVEILSDTPSSMRNLTFGLRVHHSYIGLAGLSLALPLSGALPAHAAWATIIGLALLGSDLIHHFCVLWPLTGHHEFFFSYPD